MLSRGFVLLIFALVAEGAAYKLPALGSLARQEQELAEEAEEVAAVLGAQDDAVDVGQFVKQEHAHSHSQAREGGCSGGCSGARGAPRRAVILADYQDDRPRPIFGLLSNIIETARIGYRLDSPNAHLFY